MKINTKDQIEIILHGYAFAMRFTVAILGLMSQLGGRTYGQFSFDLSVTASNPARCRFGTEILCLRHIFVQMK